LEKLEFEPIGFIQSVFKSKFGTPRQPLIAASPTAKLAIKKSLQPELSLQGLSEFSHIWLIWVFHQNSNKIFRPKIHPPRLQGETIGVFSTRSPHRPNPIGLSLVKLDRIENDVLYLSGVDLVDGTPILDIKPYLKTIESVSDATGGWVDNTDFTLLEVEFYDKFSEDLSKLKSEISPDEIEALKQMIVEILQNDPRPLVYKSDEIRDTHAMYLDIWNIFFQIKNQTVLVTGIELNQNI
jgi:tRNA-Thr(GGU) m(6)t(6)A37 methyltransferase TsaA